MEVETVYSKGTDTAGLDGSFIPDGKATWCGTNSSYPLVEPVAQQAMDTRAELGRESNAERSYIITTTQPSKTLTFQQ